MNKTIRKIIICIAIILFVIIIILIFGILNNNKKFQSDYEPQEVSEEDYKEEYNSKFRKCDITSNYFIVKNIINKYNSYRNKLLTTGDKIAVYRQATNEEALKKYKEEQAEKEVRIAEDYIYNILSSEYLKENNMSKDDIKEEFGLNKQLDIVIKNMYMMENSQTISTYFIDGMNIDNSEEKKEDFFIAVSLDINSYTFCIYPEEYCRKKGYNRIIEGAETINNLEKIEDKKYNKYDYIYNIPDGDIVKEYFYNYKYSMMYDIENAYNMLNIAYRNKRFGGIENFKNYVDENHEVLSNNIISKYQTLGNKEYKKYICLDEKNNYYIFNQDSIGEYDLCLDTYTIETEDFLEKYNSADEYKKSGMNSEKFFEAINMKDYSYIYKHLADEFKNMNFQNEAKLKKYLEDNLFIYNKRQYINYEKEADLIVLNVKVSDNYSNNANNSEKNMTIVMKLENGTDYTMSFSLN